MRAAALALAAALLAACGSGDESPGEEVTAETEPSAEPSVEASTEPNGKGGLAVQLPGLPIGGGTVAFSSGRPLQCVQVNLTGERVPDEVVATIRAFDVPPGFVAAGVSCEGLDACLGGPGLRAQDICSLPLQWDGTTVPASGVAELGVLAATLDCPDQDACNEAVADVSATGAGTVDLRVRGDAPDPQSPTESQSPTDFQSSSESPGP